MPVFQINFWASALLKVTLNITWFQIVNDYQYHPVGIITNMYGEPHDTMSSKP
jgi:hypothetical protein